MRNLNVMRYMVLQNCYTIMIGRRIQIMSVNDDIYHQGWVVSL